MAAGADSIDDGDLLRHGAMPDLLGGLRAPSTLGPFLRSLAWGNVRQLEQAGRDLLAGLARRAPLLPGADQLASVDLDSMQRRVYGHHKQGAASGHTKISGKTVNEPCGPGRDRLHPRTRLDADPLPAGHLGRPAARPEYLTPRSPGPTTPRSP